MASAEIHLGLDEAGPVRLRGRIAGRLRVCAQEPLRCERIAVRLGYASSGRCKDDTRIVDQVEWEPAELAAGSEFAQEFSFTLPDQPMSFVGSLYRIDWFVEAQVKLPWQRDLEQRCSFRVLPARAQPW